MGALISAEGELDREADCDEILSWVKSGNDHTPEPRSDEQLAVIPSLLGRIRSIYQLDGRQYVATISSVVCKHLANVELMGENDPYVKLSCGKWKDQTEYQDGAGKEAEWIDLRYIFPISDKTMKTQFLEVEVLDYNKYRKHVQIGAVTIDLSAFSDHVGLVTNLADHVNEEVHIVADLHNEQKKKSGVVEIFITLEIAADVFITEVKLKNLKNVEFMGSNDPYVKLQFGSWKEKTEYQDDAGANAEWSNLKYWFQASRNNILHEVIKLQVFDYNSIMAHSFIGEASLEFSSLLDTDELTELSLDLKDRKGKKAGTVSLNMRVEFPLAEEDKDPDIPAGTVTRELEVIQLLRQIKDLSDWGGNWRIMAMRQTNLVVTMVDVLRVDYDIDPRLDVLQNAERYSSDPKKFPTKAAVLAIKILKNLSMANITGTILANQNQTNQDRLHTETEVTVGRMVKDAGMFASSIAFNGGVLQAIAAAYFAFGGTRSKARKSEESLDDITSILWYLLDTHFERRDMSDLDRLLQSWKMTTTGHVDIWSDITERREEPNVREYICCLLWTFKNYVPRMWKPELDGDVRKELEIASLKYLVDFCDLQNTTTSIFQRLGVLRTLTTLCTCPYNRATLLLLDTHKIILAFLEFCLKNLEKNIVKIKRIPMPLDIIGDELYVPKGLSTDNKELIKQNYEINSDYWSLAAKYCVRFLTQLSRHRGIIDIYAHPTLEPQVVRAFGLLLWSGNQSECPDLAVLGLGSIASFAGTQEHGKIANLFNTKYGRNAMRDLVHTMYYMIRRRFGERLFKAVSMRLDPDYFKQVPVRDYVISIPRIKTSELKNVELSGENDPFVEMKFGKYVDRTEAIDGAGSQCEWNHQNFSFPTTSVALPDDHMRIEVFDFNDFRSNKSIGVADVNFHDLVNENDSKIGKLTEVSFDIFDSNGKKSGHVVLFVLIEEAITVKIRKISCTELKNVEMFGHNDPFVEISYGHWFAKTDAQDDAGAQAEWNALGFKYNTTDSLLKKNDLCITVFDENTARSHTAIGSTQFQISSYVNPAVDRSKNYRTYVCLISKIRVKDLINVELYGENDPFVKLQYGMWSEKTEYQDGAGSEATWENCKYQFTATDLSLASETMKIEVYDYNGLRSHAFIGNVLFSIENLKKSIGQELDMTMELTDKGGRRSGEVTVSIVLDHALDMNISKIVCKELKNVELFGKNDPYVKLALGGWRYQTEYQDDAGSSCVFEGVDITCPTTETILGSENMEVEVYDYNDINAHALIGSGSFNLSKFVDQRDTVLEFEVKLVNKKKKPSGNVKIYLKIQETPEKPCPEKGVEIELSHDIFGKKEKKTGNVSVLIKADFAEEKTMTVIDHTNDPVSQFDDYMKKTEGQHRIEAFACEFSLPLALRACLELAKNELFKYSLLEGQPLVVFRFALECFTCAKNAGDSLESLDPKSRALHAGNDGLIYELIECVSYAADILLHLMCYVELMGQMPITRESINVDMNLRIKAARNVLKERRELATTDGERKKAKMEFEVRAARAKAQYEKQLARIEREDLWWQCDSKQKVCGDLYDTVSTILEEQIELKEINSKRFLLPPETFRHLGYLKFLLQRSRDGVIKKSKLGLELSLPKIQMLYPRVKTRVAICMVHSEDRDSRYLSRKELKDLVKGKDIRRTTATNMNYSDIDSVDENDIKEDETEYDASLAELAGRQKADLRISDLVKSLLKSKVEVIVDKGGYPLEVAETLTQYGYDPKFPNLKSETLTMEILKTCAALILCVTTPTQNHPGARYVSGAAETIRRDEKNEKEVKAFWAAKKIEMEKQERLADPDAPETHSRPATAEEEAKKKEEDESEIPFSIFYVCADTGWDDDHRTAKVQDENDEEMTTEEIVYDGWVKDALASKQGKYDPETDEYEMDDEWVLPLWADDQIEATSMFIQRNLHYTTGKVEFKKYTLHHG